MTLRTGSVSISAGMIALLALIIAAISGVAGASLSYGRDYGQLVQKVESHEAQIRGIDRKLDEVIWLLTKKPQE